jgi:hypothetical protein
MERRWIMAKVRKDTKGRVLHKGEDYKKDKKLYRYSYTDPLGKRRCITSKDLEELRKRRSSFRETSLMDWIFMSRAMRM